MNICHLIVNHKFPKFNHNVNHNTKSLTLTPTSFSKATCYVHNGCALINVEGKCWGPSLPFSGDMTVWSFRGREVIAFPAIRREGGYWQWGRKRSCSRVETAWLCRFKTFEIKWLCTYHRLVIRALKHIIPFCGSVKYTFRSMIGDYNIDLLKNIPLTIPHLNF